MKSFIKRVIPVMVIMAVVLGGLSTPQVSAKKKEPRYLFGGVYIMKQGKAYWKYEFQEFSSPEGKEVGSLTIYYKESKTKNFVKTGFVDGAVKKTKQKNVYKCNYLKLRVYKKKIKIIDYSSDEKGTAKLKERYVS